MESKIEPATIEDLPELADLLVDLFSQEADFQPNRAKQLRGLRLIVEQPSRGRIFVIRNHGRILGMINLLFTISTAEGGFVILLEDMVVQEGYRRQALGSRLLEYALAFAREKGFLRITLLADRLSDASIRFYQRHGFVLSEMVPLRYIIERSLQDGSGALE